MSIYISLSLCVDVRGWPGRALARYLFTRLDLNLFISLLGSILYVYVPYVYTGGGVSKKNNNNKFSEDGAR